MLFTIPITFTHKSKEYTGQLSQVQGAGENTVYHLMINDYYKGRLRLSAFDNRWVFDGEFIELAEGFGSFIQIVTWMNTEIESNQEELFYLFADSNKSEIEY